MNKIILISTVFLTVAITGCDYFGPCLDGAGPVVGEVRSLEGFTGVHNSGSFDVFVTQANEFYVEVVAQENLVPIIETNISGSVLVIEMKNGTCYRSNSAVEIHVSLPELEELSLSGSGEVFADVAESTDFECSNSGSGHITIDDVLSGYTLITNSGSGTIDIDELTANELRMKQSGSGIIDAGTVYESVDVNIQHSSSGRVRSSIVNGIEVNATLTGSGKIDLDGELSVATYTLNSSGKIDALELEAEVVDATITGSGNIFLWATEILEATVTGSGDVIYRGSPTINFRITGSGSVRPY